MKTIRITTAIIALCFPGIILSHAQSPQAFKYQAIAHDEAGNVLSICDIGLRVSIMKNGDDETPVYMETHQVQTNIYGLINLVIGEGQKVKGEFSEIKWGENRHYLKMEMDIEGGENYKEMGSSQLYAVPYALYAEEAGRLSEEVDQPGTKQSVKKEGTGTMKTGNRKSTREGTPNTRLPAFGNSFLNTNSGNVGVGTESPVEKLEVHGNILASGTVMSEGGLIFFDTDGNPQQIMINPDGTLSPKFYCGGYITDPRDGQQYEIVKIGQQCWMAENLNTGKRINGTVTQGNNSLIEKYCYNNVEDSCDIYGGLYQWDEMMNWSTTEGANGICPESWHVPADWEWKILEGNVDTDFGVGDPEWDGTLWRGDDAGLNLKSVSGWLDEGNGSEIFGFEALPGGYFNHSSDLYYNLYENGYFWSSLQNGSSAMFRSQRYDAHEHYRDLLLKIHALSVRCIKDFVCGDTIYDTRDWKKYGTVKIGHQCWMSQNINIGDRIDGVDEQTNTGTIEKYCYDDIEANCDTLGGLYQWDEAMQYVTAEGAMGICPPGGWHIPTDVEWKILEGNVDSQYGVGNPEWDLAGDRGSDAGDNLKSTFGWYNNGNGNDSFGFTVLAAGFRSTLLNFGSLVHRAYIWTSTEYDANKAINREYFPDSSLSWRWVDQRGKGAGMSLRCIRD